MVTSRQEKQTPGTSEYHHGGLREALLDAVEAQLPEKGPEGVSLRAAAKHAGVSSAAAFRHFKDKRAVMTAVAVRAHRGMAEHMETAATEARSAGLSAFSAKGRAYLDFALSEPAKFKTMFRTALLDETDVDLVEAEARMTRLLLNGAGEDEKHAEIPAKSLLAWGAVHGLAMLSIEGGLPNTATKDNRSAILEALELLEPQDE
ncbi:TetR/AcrR family transcriptional regulator [Pseudovibrio sp. FO-BEG1]|uniref:TetR/AcrR family transcriptional regulator n=1 Tax=Pseudovibrio sp. (strain FO-BEG1) TaxID=911045 RepID=UPI00031787EF|nr:TetR/AcrR family transcriptional regulator [Pseudovibrio sp. FO-BEG1]